MDAQVAQVAEGHSLHLFIVWTIGIAFVITTLVLARYHCTFKWPSKIVVLAALALQPIIQQSCLHIWDGQEGHMGLILFVLYELLCCGTLGYLILEATLLRGRREWKARGSFERIVQDASAGISANQTDGWAPTGR